MEKSIFVIFSMLFLISVPNASCFTATDNSTENYKNLSLNDDVPIWEIGDSWTYTVDTLSVQLQESGTIIELNLSTQDLKVEVTDSTETSYLLSVSGSISGDFYYTDGAGTILQGIFLFTKISSGSAQIRKIDLAAEELHIIIRGIALLTEHPFSVNIRIPIPLTITLNILQNSPRPLIDFPLSDGKEGNLTEASMSADIKIESIVLRILHIFFTDIPSEIFYQQTINIPMLAYNATAEEVTVEAGTFSAYNISFFEGLFGSIFYSSQTGSLIKAEAELEVPDQFSVSFHCELNSFSYTQ